MSKILLENVPIVNNVPAYFATDKPPCFRILLKWDFEAIWAFKASIQLQVCFFPHLAFWEPFAIDFRRNSRHEGSLLKAYSEHFTSEWHMFFYLQQSEECSLSLVITKLFFPNTTAAPSLANEMQFCNLRPKSFNISAIAMKIVWLSDFDSSWMAKNDCLIALFFF